MKERRSPRTSEAVNRLNGDHAENAEDERRRRSCPEYVRQELSQGASMHLQDGLHINRVYRVIEDLSVCRNLSLYG